MTRRHVIFGDFDKISPIFMVLRVSLYVKDGKIYISVLYTQMVYFYIAPAKTTTPA
jgi:hypothetical protein